MKKQGNVIIGIYKVINPKGKVYIGQSVNVERRFSRYRNIHERDKQPKIYNSIKKYGWENHIHDVIEECNDFPSGANDDLVDSTTLALSRFRQGGFIRLPSDEEDDIQMFRGRGQKIHYAL